MAKKDSIKIRMQRFVDRRLSPSSRWGTFIVAISVGITVGICVTVFTFFLRTVDRFIKFLLRTDFENFTGLSFEWSSQWMMQSFVILLFIFIAGVVSGLFNKYLPTFKNEETFEFGTNSVIKSFNGHEKHISPLSSIMRTLFASPILLGTGGSAGIEGTVAYLGGGIGSLFTKIAPSFHVNRRMFIICGASAAIGAVFHAPLGASIYMAEVMYFSSDLETNYVAHSVIASVVAYAVYIAFLGYHTLFRFSDISFEVNDFPFFVLLALAVIPFSFIFTRVFNSISSFFQGMKVSRILKPAIGLSLVGFILIFFPYTGGIGYGYVQSLLNGSLSFYFIIIFVAFKILSTSLTIGSGGNGGLFGPSIVIGAMLGGLFALIMNAMGFNLNRETFIVLGMAAFLSSTENTPISSIIMITEITGTYELLIPLSLVSVTAYFLGRRSIIYGAQVESRIESSEHYGKYLNLEKLKRTKIGKIITFKADDMIRIPSSYRLDQILKETDNDDYLYLFPVYRSDGAFSGFIDTTMIMDDIADGMINKDMERLIIAEDLCIQNIPTVVEDEKVYNILQGLLNREHKMRGMENIPVMSKNGKFLGLLRSVDIIQQQMKLFDKGARG